VVEPIRDDSGEPSPPPTRADPLATAPLTPVGDGDRPGLHVRLFGSHQFFRLWLAQVVSSLGDWLGFLAITVTAQRVGSGSGGAAIGLVMTARIVPGFFLAPVAGVLVDRLDRKKVMVTCDLARAGVLCFLPFVDTVFGLVVASLLLEVFTLLWSPAKEASVPNLVPPERLASANSLSLAAAYGTLPVASVFFTLLASVAKALGHIDALGSLRVNQEALAFYADVVTFCCSAILIWTLALGAPVRRPAVGPDGEPLDLADEIKARPGFGDAMRELREGWSFIFVNPVVRAVNVGLATGLIGGGMVVPLGAVYSREVLGAGAAGYGVFVTALGVGAASGIVTVSLTQSRLPKAAMFNVGVIGAGASLLGAAAFSSLGPAATFVGLLGLFAGMAYVLGFTLLHEHVGDELRGRIFSALYTLVRLCLLIAFAVGPFLSDLFDRLSAKLFTDRTLGLPGGGELFLPGVRLTLWLAGAIIVVAGGLVFLSLRAARREEKAG
jgi:dTMP kinase